MLWAQKRLCWTKEASRWSLWGQNSERLKCELRDCVLGAVTEVLEFAPQALADASSWPAPQGIWTENDRNGSVWVVPKWWRRRFAHTTGGRTDWMEVSKRHHQQRCRRSCRFSSHWMFYRINLFNTYRHLQAVVLVVLCCALLILILHAVDASWCDLIEVVCSCLVTVTLSICDPVRSERRI